MLLAMIQWWGSMAVKLLLHEEIHSIQYELLPPATKIIPSDHEPFLQAPGQHQELCATLPKAVSSSQVTCSFCCILESSLQVSLQVAKCWKNVGQFLPSVPHFLRGSES